MDALGANMYPLSTKVYLLKGYCCSDSFCNFISESCTAMENIKRPLESFSQHLSIALFKGTVYLKMTILLSFTRFKFLSTVDHKKKLF